MSRQRKTPASSISLKQQLEAALRGLTLQDVEDFGNSIDSELNEECVEVAWRNDLLDKLEMYPEDFDRYYGIYDRFRLKITGVYSGGIITGEFVHGRSRVRMYVDRSGSTPPGACECDESESLNPCLHTFCFIDWLTDLLEDPDSELVRRLRKNQFDGEQPPNHQDSLDRMVGNVLQDLVVEFQLASEQADELPALDNAPTRLAWNIRLSGSAPTVEPVIQQKKKRGNGWTKGRKLPVEQLFNRSDLEEDDAKVRNLIVPEHSFYSVNYMLPTGDAIQALEGHPRVQLDGSPVQVQRFDAALTLKENEKHCWLELSNAGPGSEWVGELSNSVVRCNASANLVEFCVLSPDQLELIRKALSMPLLPIEYKPKLVEKAIELSHVLTLELPEEEFGPLRENSAKPVALLRANADCSVDYGFRVRDSRGLILKAGVGKAVCVHEENGRKVQLKRNFNKELAAVNVLAQQLKLPSSAEGSIQDPNAAIELIDHIENLGSDNVEILWDKNSKEVIRVLGSATVKNVSVDIRRKRDWFQLSGSVEFDGKSLDIHQLLAAMDKNAGSDLRGDYFKVGDQGWAKISAKLRSQLQKMRDAVKEDRKSLSFDATSAPAIRDLIESDIQVKTTKAWNECLRRLKSAENLDPQLPATLQAQLRDYQVEGFKWMRRLAEWGVGGILADDMGLGKTLQTLAVLLDRKELGPALVIAPTSVGFNWVSETERFAPDLNVHLYRETDRESFLNHIGPGDLVVCSYGLALRDAKLLASREWSSLVLDEAQSIKNSRSKTSQAIAAIPADWTVGLTGTPIENHLGELWSLFHVISPGVFGGWEQFRRRFASPIEKDNDESRRAALVDRLKPFVLRRTKKKVLKELPPRIETNLRVDLTPAERKRYDEIRLSVLSEVTEISGLDDVKDQRFRILALLTRMRQTACSPRLIDESWSERSSKLVQLLGLVQELAAEGHRVLVFSQFVKHLQLIREMFEAEQISYEYLDGATPAQERKGRVESFQKGAATAFLISLKAGGTGLNLTAADYVIHMDPWWNPAVEDQATDRAHRIGQENPVMVYRLIAQNTIEDEILRLHDTKRDLVEGIMAGTHAAAKLSTQDLIELVRTK